MNTPRYVVLEKMVGQTPLEAVVAWKEEHPELRDVPTTYAGRLDPMASGKLLVLLGEECKRRDAYTGLDKEYEIEVVLDVRTDTGDALGLADIASTETHPAHQALSAALRMLTGTHAVPYPAFSSKTVHGKPLFQYALEGALGEIEIPAHEETIYRMQMLDMRSESARYLQTRLSRTLSHVPKSDDPRKTLGADFRQDAIRARWDEQFAQTTQDTQAAHGAPRSFTVIALRVTCASGTYMRTLAERLGKELGTSVFALSIHRTKIGRYVPFGPFGFWRKQY